MVARFAAASMSLDIGTLFVIAICVTLLLGLFLLFAWMQDRINALAWWGMAYLLGGFSGLIWRLGDAVSPPLPPGTADVLLFIAVGMIWSAARLFHGRPVLWGSMCLGAILWVSASFSSPFLESAASHLVLSSLIIASYTFLTASELWRERRKSLIRRWPAMFVPMLHGMIFLFPVALAGLAVHDGSYNLGTGWIAIYTIEIVLYVVGTAFIVLVLAKDRTVSQYKLVAATDPLTDVLNRRGFFEAAAEIKARRHTIKQPVSVLAFDLDHFKQVNDQLGHAAGDATLRLFASVLKKTLRAGDASGRLGGEEFVAVLPANLAEAAIAAERVRNAFATASAVPGKHATATVSIGVACGAALADMDMLLARADGALYRAKANGRNRVETAAEAVAGPPSERQTCLAPVPPGTALQPAFARIRAARQ